MTAPTTLRRTPVAESWALPIRQYRRSAVEISPTVRDLRAGHLQRFARAVQDHHPDGPGTITAAEITAYTLGQAWTPATLRNHAKSIRVWFRWLTLRGIIATDPAASLSTVVSGDDALRLKARAAVRTDRSATGPEPLPVPDPWFWWIHDYEQHQRAAGLTEPTTRTRRYHLERLARALAPVTPSDVELYHLIEYMAAGRWEQETRRGVRTSIRSFFAWAETDDRIDDNPAALLPKVKAGSPLPRPAAERVIADALVDAPPREHLMLRLACELGLRRGEVAQIHTTDLTRDDDGTTLIVRGKGRKKRVIPVPDGLAAEIRQYLNGRTSHLFEGAADGHLSPKRVGELTSALLPDGVVMHQLRHRFATRAHQGSHDLIAVQQLLGHASVATTQRYVAVDTSTLRAVVAAAGTPTHGPRGVPDWATPADLTK